MFTDATWQRLEGDTPTVSVKVLRQLSWAIPASMKVGIPYSIVAHVLPAMAGVPVSLSNGAHATTDQTGMVTFTVTNDAPGFVPFRVGVASDQNFAAVQTPLVTVWVR